MSSTISEGGEDKIHFLVHIAEDFAVDELVENFLVGGWNRKNILCY